MKKLYVLLYVLFATPWAGAQIVSPTSGQAQNLRQLQRDLRQSEAELPFDATLAPFFHGVASGDPLSSQVIIWTRVTPEEDNTSSIDVEWFVATDQEFQNIIAEGDTTTNSARDYTVKVDVSGLIPSTTYYFFFSALGANSLIGRTRTTPSADEVDQLRFAVVSCSNYQAGYFNAYGRIGDRADLDAVIHLGDYIYETEGGDGTFGFDASREDRAHIPDNEILTLMDYRTRYSLYRLDPDLRRAHQQHPFIAVWDDHESANDAYTDGAENHNEGEGLWETRRDISKQVYFEWMPIRDNADNDIFRTINYGDLVDLIMIDTRLEGRNVQINDITDPALFSPDRTLLGEEQREWFLNELQNSTAQWKVIGNQVIFSEFHVGWAADPSIGQTFEDVENLFLDIWDGYPVERNNIIQTIASNDIDNVIFLTGDFHSTFAYDVAKFPSIFSLSDPLYALDPISETGLPGYDPASQAGSVAVEFATPSVTTSNFDENLIFQFLALGLPEEEAIPAGIAQSAALEFQINNPLPEEVPQVGGFAPNPHMRFVDLDRHGYFLLDLTTTSAQADWYYVDILNPQDDTEEFGLGMMSTDSRNSLSESENPSTPKSDPPALASDEPLPVLTSTPESIDLAVFNLYPNPIQSGETAFLQLGLLKNTALKVRLTSIDGRNVADIYDGNGNKGVFTLTYTLSNDLPSGIYFVSFETEDGQFSRRIYIE